MAARGGVGEPLTNEQRKLVGEALKVAQRDLARMARRCPVLTPSEVTAHAEDALMAKVHTFQGTRGTSLFEYAKKNIRGRILRAAGRRGKEHARHVEALVLLSDTLDELPLSELSFLTNEDIDGRLIELGEEAGDAVLYGLACSPEGGLLNRELREALHSAMAEEGAVVRAILDALFYEDETFETAAERVGVSKTKAHTLVHAAFARMRARLAAWDTQKK
jgi:DNA-directed RNA polymerase specialized sigma24 family protein